MNFLAHAYLSGDNPRILAGNFVGDSVKGKMLDHLPPDMSKGVLLHRFIDDFTDNHPIVKRTRQRMNNRFGKYSWVVSDVYFDHFLALHWNDHSNELLDVFIQKTYTVLQDHFHHFPERSQQMIPFLIRQNWLGAYASIEGISVIMERMSRRASFPSKMEEAGEELLRDYSGYRSDFEAFFPELREKTFQELQKLQKHG